MSFIIVVCTHSRNNLAKVLKVYIATTSIFHNVESNKPDQFQFFLVYLPPLETFYEFIVLKKQWVLDRADINVKEGFHHNILDTSVNSILAIIKDVSVVSLQLSKELWVCPLQYQYMKKIFLQLQVN